MSMSWGNFTTFNPTPFFILYGPAVAEQCWQLSSALRHSTHAFDADTGMYCCLHNHSVADLVDAVNLTNQSH